MFRNPSEYREFWGDVLPAGAEDVLMAWEASLRPGRRLVDTMDPETRKQVLWTILDSARLHDWFSLTTLRLIWDFRTDPIEWAKIKSVAQARRIRPQDLIEALDAADADGPEKAPLMALSDLLALEQEVSFVVQSLLPHGGLSIVAADPKCGKTTLVRNLVACVAEGRMFLDRQTVKSPVVYHSYEEPPAMVAAHFRKLAPQGAIWCRIGPLPRHKVLSTLRADIQQVKAKLAVVDPLFDAITVVDGNSYTEVNYAIKELLAIAREENCHIVAVHHTAKGLPGTARAILGSQALRGGTDTNITLTRRDEARFIEAEVRSGQRMNEQRLMYDPDSGEVCLEYIHDNGEERILETLGQARMRFTELRNASHMNLSRASAAIHALMNTGAILWEKEGRTIWCWKNNAPIDKPSSGT